MPEFDIKKVQKYVEKTTNDMFKHGAKEIRVLDDSASSIMFFFDKNKDGKITLAEYQNASREEYSIFTQQLSQHLSNSTEPTTKIYSYDELGDFFKKGVVTGEDLMKSQEGFIKPEITTDENGNKIEQERTFEENKNLKNFPQMSEEEIVQEAESYGISRQLFKRMFTEVRQERNEKDKGSNEIDGHIGTYNQGSLSNCTVLARIGSLTDEEWQSMYEKKTDKKGNEYYEINFPSDNKKHPVKITAEEIQNHAIKHKGRLISGFSTGDLDVMLIEMAHIKRYGHTFEGKGAFSSDILNDFSQKGGATNTTEITEEMLMSNTIKQLGLLTTESLKEKNIKEGTIKLDSGLEVEIKETLDNPSTTDNRRLKLPDGTIIYGKHAYTFVSYDQKTKTVTLKNPHENSTDIKLPLEVMKLFHLAQVDKNNS